MKRRDITKERGIVIDGFLFSVAATNTKNLAIKQGPFAEFSKVHLLNPIIIANKVKVFLFLTVHIIMHDTGC